MIVKIILSFDIIKVNTRYNLFNQILVFALNFIS